MYPRVNYEMTEEDLNTLLSQMQAVPMIMIGSIAPKSQQERANDAWESLGRKMGFDYMTVQPISGKGSRFFTAIPSETESQREERLKQEVKKKREKELHDVEDQIGKLEAYREKLMSIR